MYGVYTMYGVGSLHIEATLLSRPIIMMTREREQGNGRPLMTCVDTVEQKQKFYGLNEFGVECK